MAVTITGVHPYADKFPMLSDAELGELAESIAENGLRSPIVLTPDGLILDGRNRAAACERAGVAPTTIVYEGDDLAEYVIDCNSSRRHMSTGARAMATALVLVEAGRREDGRWVGWSRTFQNSGKSSGEREALRCAGVILDHSPDLAAQIVSGELRLDAAYRQACEARDAERALMEAEQRIAAEEDDARAFLAERDPQRLAKADKAGESARQAKAAWEDQNRRAAAVERQRRDDARRKAEKIDKDRTHTYTGLVEAVRTLSGYGAYDDPLAIMRDYEPRYVQPGQLRGQFTPDLCRDAARFATALISYLEEAK